jgi:hypothetical protein
MKRLAGRPRLPRSQVKAVVIAIRVTETEMAEIATAAGRAGTTAARWARDVLLAALSTR